MTVIARLAGAAALLLTTAAAAQAAHDTLVIGIAQFPSSLNPYIDAETIKDYTDGFALRPVTAYDKDWKDSCRLCAQLPDVEDGSAKTETLPDGRTGMAVTLKLRPDMKWADGVPVTTHDLEFTWRAAHDPAAGFINARAWQVVNAIDIVDAQTAVLHLGQTWAQYNEWPWLLPEHVEAPVRAAAGAPGDYIRQTIFNHAPTTPGLWDGPYMVSGYQSGVQVEFSPNPYWPGPKPGFKHVLLKLIENTAALQANLLSGDVDMVAGDGVGLTIDQGIALQQQYPDRFTYIFRPTLSFEHLVVQKDNPILGDLRVRQALLYALDRQTLVDKLFRGLQPVAATWVNPLSPFYSRHAVTYGYDPAKARQLLADAGWKPGSDGICRNDRGDRLSFELTTTAGNRLRELQEQVLQSQWKAVCAEATLKNEPARVMFGQTLKHRAYPGMVMYAGSYAVTETPRRILGSDQIATEANNWSGGNYTAFSNADFDRDLGIAETELDPARRKAAWADMQRIYAEQLPELPLFFRAEPHVIPKWLHGYAPTGHSDLGTLWSENWVSD
ncbi:MAG: peptide ABC transporter substrate-binding protein [Acidisphaera sp.]|nr:peptide ABC transporter substrate-binding protein [Acidisphaera sp.]